MKTMELCEKVGKGFLPSSGSCLSRKLEVLRFRESLCRSSAFSVCLFFLSFLVSAVSGFAETPYFQEIRSIPSSRMKVSGPVGLTFIGGEEALFVIPRSSLNPDGSGSSPSLLTLTGRPLDKVGLPMLVQNPLNVAFSNAEKGLYILLPSSRTLLKIPITKDGQLELDTSFWELSSLGSIPLRDPAGMTFDPGTGTLYILDGGQQSIVTITPQSNGNLNAATALTDGRVQTISVKGTGLFAPRGIAFDPQNRSLYILSPSEKKIYQLDDSGHFRNTINISEFELIDPQGMTFAPSADSTDDPAIMHLYIADDGLAAGQTSAGTGGQIMEFSLTAPIISAAALAAPTVPATLVRTIDTWRWSPPSPDPAGIDYIPALGNYLVGDSEVDEMTIFTGVNLFEMTPTGSLTNTFSTTTLSRSGFSNEPTGLAHNDANGHWFISDDDNQRVFEIDLGPDHTYGTSDDVRTSFKTSDFGSDDPEGVAFDSQHQVLFIADGVNTEVYKITPGINGVFDGVPPAGDDVMTHFDTGAFGMTDLEGIEYNPSTQTIYLTGGYSSSTIYECTTDGVLVRNIDISAAEPTLKAPAGLAYGPGSGGPNTRSLYLVARGVDNNGHPDENDGEAFEFALSGPVITSFSPTSGGESTPVTITGAGFTGATSVTFNGTSASFTVSSDSQIGTTVPSGATTGPIGVTASGGTAVSTSDFTVTTSGPSVSISPSTLDFGDQVVSITSSVQSVTVTNNGSSDLHISTVSLTGTDAGDFATSSDNCSGATVSPTGSCTIGVTFTPTATGSRSASLSISDDATDSPQSIDLTGTGTAPMAEVSPANLTFGNQPLNTTSGAQAVTLSNTGTAALTISGITVTGTNASDFSQSNDCGSSVAAGASCTINVTFTPTATGGRSASLSISDDASGSPQTVGLMGTGVSSTVTLSAASLTFTSQAVGTTSPAQMVTLTNIGSSTLTINGITVTGANAGDFSQSNDCGSSVAAGGNCTISVTFTPTGTGTRTAAVSISDSSPDSPQSIGLTGTGSAAAPAVSLSANSLAFGDQALNTPSAPQPVTLSNTGNAALTISGITVTGTNAGDFSQSNDCGSSVAAGASCTINVTFTPTATGIRTASVSITDDAIGSPQTVSLSGNGVTGPPDVTGVIPPTMQAGTSGTLTISGRNFAPGATVSFSGPGRAPTVDSLTFINAEEIDVAVTTYTSGPKRDRVFDVTVTNPDGSSGTLSGGFTVTYP